MSMSDPIADLIARINNAGAAGHKSLTVPASKMKKAFLEVLMREGFIESIDYVEVRKGISNYVVDLRYHNGTPVICEMRRISRPGRRVYRAVNDIQTFYNGLGIYILSTSQGLMTDHEARKANTGGELLCQVF
ncbi:MAG: 30S ribosomal protein S8 [Alphaproteobacteria bacterium]|nr:30S ribosomal protein S8 [Alphaproteobacteria bacterium]